jgi:hypothetical protein
MTYDQFFKGLLRLFWTEFLELFAPDLLEAYYPEPLEWVPLRVPTDPARSRYREADLVALLRPRQATDEERLVDAEVQAGRESGFRQRMLLHYSLFRVYYHRPVTIIVIYLEARGCGIDLEILEEGELGTQVRLEYRRGSLPKLAAVEYLARDNALGWGLTAFMDPREMRPAELKARALKRILLGEPDDLRREWLTNCVETYLLLTEAEQREYEALLRQEEYAMLVDVTKITETYLERQFREYREKMEPAFIEELEQKVRDQLEQRIQERIEQRIRQESELRGQRRLLLHLLRAKFGDLPTDVPAQLEDIPTAEKLDDLSERLLTAATLADLGLSGDGRK